MSRWYVVCFVFAWKRNSALIGGSFKISIRGQLGVSKVLDPSNVTKILLNANFEINAGANIDYNTERGGEWKLTSKRAYE